MIVAAQNKKGLLVSKTVIYVAIFCGFAVLATVGLVCGFAARKTCPKSSTTTTPMSSITTSSTTTTTMSTTTTTTTPTTTTRPIIEDDIRLPDFQDPVNYNLDVRVYFDPTLPIGTTDISPSDRFEGRAIIDFHLLRASKFITFHVDSTLSINANSLGLTNLNTSQTGFMQSSQHSYDSFTQLYRVDFPNDLQPGLYRMSIEYSGNYGPIANLVGFYRTRYTEDGVIKQLVATKFQPTDARKAYPCFDEPGFKATYEIAIEHPIGTKAFSNWPELPRQTIEQGTRYRTTFQKTDPMSSYLVAWVVLPDDFGFKSLTTQNGKPIRVFARKDAVNAGLIDFALDMTKLSLDFFETQYFDPTLRAVPPKIDMVGLPDFPSGAMEHWGIVGYRETSLLFKDGENSVSSKQSVAFTIAHEISHFWFGNLVTCKWWNDLWLNEGMARFMQFKAVQNIFPEWDVDNQFLTLYEIPVMYDDGFQTSQPISVEVSSPAQINSLFTSITYDKGSSILRMLEYTVGEENFRQGLNNFLKANEFDSAIAATFYNSLKLPDDMTGVTPQEYMENWLLQINYPEVSVNLTNNQQGNTRVRFSQNRFLLLQESNTDTPSPFGYQWLIYLKCRAGGQAPNNHLSGNIRDFTYFLNQKSGEIVLDRAYTWVKCNNNFRGYYVTNYSPDQFEIFTSIFLNNPNVFTNADRANIIHDVFALAYLGTQSYSLVSGLANYLEFGENEYVPWRAFTWHVSKIASVLEHRPSFPELRDFAIAITRDLSERLQIWENNGTHVEKLFKNNIIDFMGRMQDEINLRKSTEVFEGLDPLFFTDVNNIFNNIPPTIRGTVYKYHVQNSYKYADLFEMAILYEQTVDPQEKSIALNAMSFTRLVWLLDFLFYDIMQPTSTVRPQDFFTLTIAISRNPTGRHLSWLFLRSRWDEIINKFGASSRTLANAVKSMVETFENEFLLEELKEFFDSTNPGAGTLQRKQALEIVTHNIFWINNREPDIIQNLFEPRTKIAHNKSQIKM